MYNLPFTDESHEQKNKYLNDQNNNQQTQQSDNEIYYDAEEEHYSDAQEFLPDPAPPLSTYELNSSALGEGPATASPFSALVRQLVGKTLFSIQLRLFARMGGMEELYFGLRRLAQSNKPLARRLLELSALLNRHVTIVSERHQQILHYAAELTSLAISLYQHGMTWQEDISARLRSFARHAEHLLSLELVRDQVAVDERHRLELMAKQLHKMALLLDLHQSMPEGSSFDEWLQQLALQEVLPDLVQERLLKYNAFSARLRELGEEVSEINQRYPLPAENDWAGRVNWVQQVLNDPTTAGQLKTYLPPELEEMVNISAPLVQLINHFPTGNSLAEQLVWAGQKVIAPPPELLKLVALSPFSEFVTSARRNLNDHMINPALFNALLELASPGQSLWQKSLNIISLSFSGVPLREAISFALRSAVSTYLPRGDLLLNAWGWYQTLPEGLSWQETLERFTTDLQQSVCTHPHLLRAILPDTVVKSADALSVLIKLPVDKSWPEILRWASSRLGKEKEYDWLYQRYLELSLARGVFEALKQRDNRQRETVLRVLAESLQGYLALRPDSGLRQLLDLLPYLPLLAGIREEITAMPGNDSWLGRACNLLTVLAKHPHLALTELRQQLETQIVNFLSDSMIAGVDAIWEQLPDDPLRFPGAEAAPVPETHYAPGTFWTQQPKTLDESNLAKHGDKKAQAERTSEETNAHGSAENKAFIIASRQADQLLDELFAMIDEYEKGSNSGWTKEDDAHFQDYAIFGGLTAGWLATLFLFWRAYRQVAPNHTGENDIEMQELNPHANPETVRNNNAEEGLLPDSPRPGLSVNKKRYLLPSILLSVMSGATAWAAWQRWGAENPLTLQQVFRQVLAEENHTALSEDAPTTSQGHIINKRSVAEGSIINISSLRATFLLWNIKSNVSVKSIINAFEIKLKEREKENQEKFLLLIELIDYMLIHLRMLTISMTDSDCPIEEFAEDSISMMAFMDKAVSKVEIIKPNLYFKDKLKSSQIYKKIQGVFSLTLVNLLSDYIITPDDYTLYNVLRTGNLFNFEDLPQFKTYFTTKATDYEGAYPGGIFDKNVYVHAGDLIKRYKFDDLDNNDVTDNKKRALYFYLNKNKEYDVQNRLPHNDGEDFHPETLEARELMNYTGQRIIDVLSSITVHDELIEKAQSEIKKGTSQTAQSASKSWKSYHDMWDEYGISSFDIIDKYAREYNQREGTNLYLRGSTEAINKLLDDRAGIIKRLILNFTRPEEITQQCALFLLLTRHINKISAYQAELNKILNIASEIYSDTDMYALTEKLNDKNFGFQSVINSIKVDAVSKINKKINKTLTDQESLDYYDLLMNDTSENTLDLKESIIDYIKVREYLLYLNLKMKGYNVHGEDNDDRLRKINLESFNKLNSVILEEEALSYVITPSAVERYTPLEQVSREANNYSTSANTFYRLYNDYIRSDSTVEAKYDTFKLLMLYKNKLDTYQDIFEQPQSVEEYKITYYVDSEEDIEPYSHTHDYDAGSVKIITLSDNRMYILSTLTDFPVVTSCNEKIVEYLDSTRRNTIDDLIKNIYEDYASEHLDRFNKKIDKFRDDSLFLSHIEKEYYTINKLDKNKSTEKPIKDIVYDCIHDSYVKIATSLKDQGSKTPFDYLLGLIPFYSVIKRSLSDPDYHPTVADMAWDIVDLSVSLALLGAKKFYDAVNVVKSILTRAEKSLGTAGKIFTGVERYHHILKIATPEIIKKFPTMGKVLKGSAEFTANALNPLGAFIFLGSKAGDLGKFAIKKIPKRGRKTLHPDADSFIVQENKVASTGAVEPLGKQFDKDLKYADEMSDGDILAAKKQLPPDLFSDPTLNSYARTPTGRCDKAADKVIEILSHHGYDTRVIGTLTYKTVLDTEPLNHYAVIASKNGVELVIDVTFDQFISKMTRQQQWVITSWEDWCRKITSSDKLQTSLIMSKEYKELSAARSEIAFTNNKTYLESSHIRDPDFHILFMPSRFTGHLNNIYKNDTKLISTSEGILKLTIAGKLLAKKEGGLRKLIRRENKDLKHGKDTPVSILDDIEKTKRSIKELKSLELLPDRISNYLYLNKSDFINPESNLYIHTPVSYKLSNLFESVGLSSTNNIGNVTSINEQGLAIINNRYFIMHNEELYPIILAPNSKNKATLRVANETIDIEYTKFKWEIVENSYRRTDQTITDKLRGGSVSPLRNRGLLNASENTTIETPFDFIRLDKEVIMSEVKKFSPAEFQGSLTDKITTATGDKLSSTSFAGPVLGKWKQGDINESVDFIEVSNGSSGCVGIRIPFEQLPADRPVIVSGGELSGCTMIYATDDKYFYVYHSGQRPGDTDWLTSQQGVNEIYKAHLAFKGTPIPSLTNKKLTNGDLPTIFSEYQSSLVTYLGKNTSATGNTRISQDPWSNVNTFDYNKISTNNDQSRVGLAYAVLTKNNNKVNVTAYSEDLAINNQSRKLQPLASQHQVLKGHISSSQESVFKTTIDTLEDLYTTFVGRRNFVTLYEDLKSSSVGVPNLRRQDEIKNPGRNGGATNHAGTWKDPKDWNTDYGLQGDIFKDRGNGFYYKYKKTGKPSEHNWPYIINGKTNKMIWVLMSAHAGTWEDPKDWDTDYGHPDDIFKDRDNGYYYQYRQRGKPAKNSWYYTHDGKTNETIWELMSLHAGTWEDPKDWDTDYGRTGDLFKSVDGIYFKYKQMGKPSKNKWYYIRDEKIDEKIWEFMGYGPPR